MASVRPKDEDAKKKDLVASLAKVNAQAPVAPAPEPAPAVMPEPAPELTPAPSPEASSDGEMSLGQMLAMAAISLGPALLGGALGGKQGAMAGAASGTGAAAGYAGGIAKKAEDDRKLKLAQQEQANERKADWEDFTKKEDYKNKNKDKPAAKVDLKEYEGPDGNTRLDRIVDGKLVKDPKDEIVSYKKPDKEKDPKPEGSDLAIDRRKEVEALAVKNANKRSISATINGMLDQFKAAKTKDEQIRIGRMMLKSLNSQEGADAIGVEESRRLGDAIEFQIANWTGPGPLVGRDLDGFQSQVESTVAAINAGVATNQARIDELMGRAKPPAPKPKTVIQNGHTYTLNEKTGEYE